MKKPKLNKYLKSILNFPAGLTDVESADENLNLFEFRVHEDGYEFFYENVVRSQLIDSF